MVSLEDTELSCAAGLQQGEVEGKESSGCFRYSFSLLLHKYNGLSVSVNLCPAVHLPPVGSAVSSAWVFCLFCDPGRHVEMMSSESAAWQLPCFPCRWCFCSIGTLPEYSGSDQLSFLFWNGKEKPKITTMTNQGLKGKLHFITTWVQLSSLKNQTEDVINHSFLLTRILTAIKCTSLGSLSTKTQYHLVNIFNSPLNMFYILWLLLYSSNVLIYFRWC